MEDKYLYQNTELMKDWDWRKNNELGLDPHTLTASSNKKVWWLCSKCAYEWSTTVGNRAGALKRGCKNCNRNTIGDKLSKSAAKKNNIMMTNAYLEKEWDYSKNGELKPSEVSSGSDKFVWWICQWCGHEWKTQVKKRALRGNGCPRCSKQSTSFQEQAIYYYVKKIYKDAVNRDLSNGFELDIFIPSLNVGIEYDGKTWHKTNKKLVMDNIKDENCKNKGITLYRFRDPILENTLNSIRINCIDGDNSSLEESIVMLLELLCQRKVCVNVDRDKYEILELYKRNMQENSIAYKFPNLVEEWHPTKNKMLSPQNIAWSSGIKIWWKCKKCGYEYQAAPNHRTRKGRYSGCIRCGREKVNKSNQVKIINLDTGIVYESLTEAAESCGGRKSDICSCCTNKQKTAHGYRWAYVDITERRTKNFKGKIKNVDTGEVFESSKIAAEWCNGDTRVINRCCNGKTKTAYGYRWEYMKNDM